MTEGDADALLGLDLEQAGPVASCVCDALEAKVSAAGEAEHEHRGDGCEELLLQGFGDRPPCGADAAEGVEIRSVGGEPAEDGVEYELREI